jgi:hypothetical protein
MQYILLRREREKENGNVSTRDNRTIQQDRRKSNERHTSSDVIRSHGIHSMAGMGSTIQSPAPISDPEQKEVMIINAKILDSA